MRPSPFAPLSLTSWEDIVVLLSLMNRSNSRLSMFGQHCLHTNDHNLMAIIINGFDVFVSSTLANATSRVPQCSCQQKLWKVSVFAWCLTLKQTTKHEHSCMNFSHRTSDGHWLSQCISKKQQQQHQRSLQLKGREEKRASVIFILILPLHIHKFVWVYLCVCACNLWCHIKIILMQKRQPTHTQHILLQCMFVGVGVFFAESLLSNDICSGYSIRICRICSLVRS